jgi:tRNA modification GTPase
MNYADTIVAVSSATGGLRSILRVTGPETLTACRRVFTAPIPLEANGILAGSVAIEDGLTVDARLYLFFAPHSYTGEDLAELHVQASGVLVEALVQRLLASGVRTAGPGEFTARAYLNGKLDLAQAEAVNEIIASSNRFQLKAAERLLSGRLTQSTDTIRSALMDCLSLIEAGLDFSGEDIEFISAEDAVARLNGIGRDLEELLAGSIRYEALLDLPAVGIAGAPNAGKSSLLNALLGHDRSIVSDQPKTTRDVLSGLLRIDRFQCVLFDCAGLLGAPDNILDQLTQQAAIEALRHCDAVIFCVDAANPDWSEDLSVRTLIEPKTIIYVATKSDLLPSVASNGTVERLSRLFDAPFLAVSVKTGQGLDALRSRIFSSCVTRYAARDAHDEIALTTRHRQTVSEAVESVRQAGREIARGNEEVAAALIRTAYEALAGIGQQPLDEQILDRIFSRFCIGK